MTTQQFTQFLLQVFSSQVSGNNLAAGIDQEILRHTLIWYSCTAAFSHDALRSETCVRFYEVGLSVDEYIRWHSS